MADVLTHALAHTIVNILTLPITILLMMSLRFGGFFHCFKLPTPSVHQMVGIALLIMMAS